MLNAKKTTVTILACLLVVAVMLPILPISVMADSVADLSDNLIVHYDFEGDVADGTVLKDKATAGTSNDDLSSKLWSGADYSCEFTDAPLDTYFTLEDGVITSKIFAAGDTASNDDKVVLITGDQCADIQSVNKADEQNATWFIRYLVSENYTGNETEGDRVIFDANHQNALHYYGFRRTNSDIRSEIFGKRETFTWSTLGTWRNTMISKSYNADGTCTVLRLTLDDDMQVLEKNETTYAAADLKGSDEGVLALFAMVSETALAGKRSGGVNSQTKGLSIDDFRIYNTAVTEEQIKDIINNDFGSSAPVVDYSANLIVHYDFEGDVADGTVLKDKATAGTSNDDLSSKLWSGADYSCEFTDAPLDTYFTLEDGVITSKIFAAGDTASNDDKIVLLTGDQCADIQSVNKADEQNATWFIRYLVSENYTGNESEGDRVIFDANHQSALHYYGFRRTNSDIRSEIFGQRETFTWSTLGTWRNTMISKSYNADGTCTVLRVTFDDELQVLEKNETTYAAADLKGSEEGVLALFAMVNETAVADKRSGGVNSQTKGLSIDDFRIYNTAITEEELKNILAAEFEIGDSSDDDSQEDDSTVTPSTLNGAYVIGNEFTMFIDMENEDLVKVSNAWALTDDANAMGGKALVCNTAVSDVNGDGLTIRFAVPAEGDYYFWSRVSYKNAQSNSLFYRFDNGSQFIWDMPDEDELTAACYQSYHYFYMTQRLRGTYTDTTQYGSWTIDNGDWRHAPNKIHLTAGVHELKITGREAGIALDELVITSYEITEYDPNACEGNSNYLESCKFCGTNWKHYCKDGYAINQIKAETTFTTAHTDAVVWECPYNVAFPEDNTPPAGGDQPGGNQPGGNQPGGNQPGGNQPGGNQPGGNQPGGNQPGGEDDGGGQETEPVTTPVTAPTTDDTTTEEKGCGSSVGLLSVIGMLGLSFAFVMKRKEDI